MTQVGNGGMDFKTVSVFITIAVEIIDYKLLKCHSIAKRMAPAYSPDLNIINRRQ